MSKRDELTASFALMKEAFRELLEIDSPETPEKIRQGVVDAFFDGEFYTRYDSTTGHLTFAPTPKLVAEMQSSDADQPSKNKRLS